MDLALAGVVDLGMERCGGEACCSDLTVAQEDVVLAGVHSIDLCSMWSSALISDADAAFRLWPAVVGGSGRSILSSRCFLLLYCSFKGKTYP